MITEILRQLPHHVKPWSEWLDNPNHYEMYPKVFRALGTRRLFEIGTCLGYSLAAAAAGVPELESVEWVDNESYLAGSNRLAVENIEEARKLAGHQPINMKYNGHPYQPDVFHIDGDHTEGGCCLDLGFASAFRPRFIVGHDYTLDEKKCGVREAVRRYCRGRAVEHLVLKDFQHGLYVIAVTGDLAEAKEALSAEGIGNIEVI